MKNVLIIHGYNGDTSETFGPYLQNECEKRNIGCVLPVFPMKQEATFENWKEVMDRYWKSGQINEETVVVAHSLGTLFLPKYLSERGIKIYAYISIAGFIDDHSGREDLKVVVDRFKPSEDDYDNLIKLVKKRYSIYSDNDHLNPQDELERYADRIKAEKVFVKGIGHCGRKSGVKELPEVLEIIDSINMSNENN